MIFTPIASSSAGCAYILRDGANPPLLLDCGVAIERIRESLGCNLTGVGGCLISHAHKDHCRAIGHLLRRGVYCFASKETFDQITHFRRPQHRAIVIEADKEFDIPLAWRVKPFATVHDSPGALGFYIAGTTGTCVYLTDTAYSPVRFANVTHLAIECNFSKEILRQRLESKEINADRYKRTYSNHMSLERVVELLKANDLSRLEETWLLHLSDANSDEEMFKDAIQRVTGKPVYVAAK